MSEPKELSGLEWFADFLMNLRDRVERLEAQAEAAKAPTTVQNVSPGKGMSEEDIARLVSDRLHHQ